ncbi:MAG TPA: pilus assembly protein PilP [Candidatus Dormibacteraeota bacterium]|nr:pilus assembly protein PilP [Candidatus Dormibacteraeota bacterium]
MRSVMTLVIGILLTAAASCLHAQAQSAASAGGAKSAPPAAAKRKPAKVPAKTPSKSSAKAGMKAPAKASPRVAASHAVEQAPKTVRRDPFESLVGRQRAQADAAKNLPPGKAGLQVSTLRLDGIVKSSNGMIAVVSNPQARTYFLREGDQLYDGRVEKIAMDGVSFHEIGKDAFGKPVERQVNKRINSSVGEQQ